MNENGESVEHVDQLIEDLNKFHTMCQVKIQASINLNTLWKNLYTIILHRYTLFTGGDR